MTGLLPWVSTGGLAAVATLAAGVAPASPSTLAAGVGAGVVWAAVDEQLLERFAGGN